MIKILLIGLLKTAAVTIVIDKLFKQFGKKDFGDVIKLAGWSECGIYLVQIVKYLSESDIINKISKVLDFFMG